MSSKTEYRALVGLAYPPGKRVKAGDVVSDLPAQSIPHLLERGHIEPLRKPRKEAK